MAAIQTGFKNIASDCSGHNFFDFSHIFSNSAGSDADSAASDAALLLQIPILMLRKVNCTAKMVPLLLYKADLTAIMLPFLL